MNLSVFFFADDTTVYYSSKNITKIFHKINNDLNSLEDYFMASKLSLNISKINYMVFPLEATKHENFNNEIINKVNKVQFLGMIIDEKLTWREHINYRCNTMSSGL